MKLFAYILILFTLVFSCKKAENRKCFKTNGLNTERIVYLDSVKEFKIYKNIKYRFYQDTIKKIVIKGGQNMLNLINVSTIDNITSITNLNKCKFVRNNKNKVEVDIHYPYYHSIYAESTDSVIFMDTIKGNYLSVHARDGGGAIKLNTTVKTLSMGVSFGVGNFIVGGKVENAHLFVQNLGRGNALNLSVKYLNLYQNSNADMLVNFDSTHVNVLFYGNGDIRFTGVPLTLNIEGAGNGEVITY